MAEGKIFNQELQGLRPREGAEAVLRYGVHREPHRPVFEDRRLFADFFTAYYTDWEPESAFVMEVGGEVKGYLLGSRSRSGNNCIAFTRTRFCCAGISSLLGL